jgi:hypothetical protein
MGGSHQGDHLSSANDTIHDFLPMHWLLMETDGHSIWQQWTKGHRKVLLIHTKIHAKEMEVVLHFFGSQFPMH